MQSAVVPEDWHAAGLSVVNLALSSGCAWDTNFLLERGGLPDSIDLIVYDVEYWDFNEGFHNESRHQRIRRFGDLGDRFAETKQLLRWELMHQWAFPTYLKRSINQWGTTIVASFAAKLGRPSEYHERSGTDFETQLELAEQFQARNIFPKHLSNLEWSKRTEVTLRELVERCVSQGTKLVLLFPPLRNEYIALFERDSATRRHKQCVDELCDSLQGELVTVIRWNTAVECGETDNRLFSDYGHFSRVGATRFSTRLREELARRDLLTLATEER